MLVTLGQAIDFPPDATNRLGEIAKPLLEFVEMGEASHRPDVEASTFSIAAPSAERVEMPRGHLNR